MILPHAIEFDVGISADRSVDVIVDLAGGAGGELSKLVNAAAVYGELRQLLIGDYVADLTGIGLHADFVSFNSYCFTGAADGHLEIQAGTIADLQDDALLLSGLESSGFDLNVVVPDWQVGSYILAVTVAGEVISLTGFSVRDGDCCIGNCRAGGIRDGSDDGGILTKGLARNSQDEQGKK